MTWKLQVTVSGRKKKCIHFMIFQNSVTGGGGGGNAYAELSFHVIPLSFKNDFDIKKIQLQNIFIFFENSCG